MNYIYKQTIRLGNKPMAYINPSLKLKLFAYSPRSPNYTNRNIQTDKKCLIKVFN